jgi:hypothetical protein
VRTIAIKGTWKNVTVLITVTCYSKADQIRIKQITEKQWIANYLTLAVIDADSINEEFLTVLQWFTSYSK